MKSGRPAGFAEKLNVAARANSTAAAAGTLALMAGLHGSVALAQGHQNVAARSLEVVMAGNGTGLHAAGSWVTRLKRGPSLSIASVNTVEISCSKSTMTCQESRAELAPAEARLKASSEPAREHLSLATLMFTVTEWTDTRITARSDTRNGDLMLRIVPSERLVRLSYWETKDKDSKDAATGFMWELQ